MAFERNWPAVPPVAFTASGTTLGKITVTSAAGFKVKQEVVLVHPTRGRLNLQVKKVTSPTTVELGSVDKPIQDRVDLSAYDTTTIIYANEQPQSKPTDKELNLASYDQEPTVAWREVIVDQFGNYISPTNPLPVQLSDGSINIETLNAELRVELTAKDNDPKAGDIHSSVRVGDGTNELGVNGDGSINVNVIQSSSVSTPGLGITYREVTAIASGSETTLISLVAPPSGLRISKVMVSGENLALYKVSIDSNPVAAKRTWWNHFNEEFVFDDVVKGLLLTNGQVLTVTVLHNRPAAGNFEVTVMAE